MGWTSSNHDNLGHWHARFMHGVTVRTTRDFTIGQGSLGFGEEGTVVCVMDEGSRFIKFEAHDRLFMVPPWELANLDITEAIKVGARIRVLSSFASKYGTPLNPGDTATVKNLFPDGDVQIQFDAVQDLGLVQPIVEKCDVKKLEVVSQEPATGRDDVVGCEDSASGNEGDAEASSLCCVCMAKAKTHALLPCGHRCVCASCADAVVRRCQTCPICRSTVEQRVQIFI